MSEESLRETILRLAAPAVSGQGLETWGLELNESGRMLVRLYVETPASKESLDAEPLDGAPSEDGEEAALLSATIDQCESISRQLAFALEAEDVIDRAYTLEVSTPGFNRIFFSLDQMRPYVGDMVEARMLSAYSPTSEIPTRRSWRGVLQEVGTDGFTIAPASVDDDGEVILEEMTPVALPFDRIRRVNRIYVFRRPQKPGKGRKNASAKANKGKIS